jgi:hypothetical protein
MKKSITLVLLIISYSISSKTILSIKGSHNNKFQISSSVLDSEFKKCFLKQSVKSKNENTTLLFGTAEFLNYYPDFLQIKNLQFCYGSEVTIKNIRYIKSNEDLSLAKRKGDVLFGILDQYIGEEIVLSKIDYVPFVDGIIYFQLGTEFFKRQYEVIDSRWFGFVSDLVLDKNNNYVSGTDNSEKFINLLAHSGNIKFSKGNYFFNNNGFKIKSNTNVDLDNSVLKYRATQIYLPFLLIGGESFITENINLSNGIILGSKNEFSTVTEFMHGINIMRARNIKIKDIQSNLNKGDGLFIGMNNEVEENRSKFIEITDCIFDRNHRQGCSIVSGQNITFTNTKFTNTKGTAPQSGVDIETDNQINGIRNLCFNIKFFNCEFSGNASIGAMVNGIINNAANAEDISNIEFSNSVFKDNLDAGIGFRACNNVIIDNCNVYAVENGIVFSEASYKNITIKNTKVIGNKSGIGIYILKNTSNYVSESIKIDNCEVYNFGRYGVLVEEKSSTFLKNFMFTNNYVHNNYNNIHIQKGVVNAYYSGNKSTNVGLDVDNVKYPGWTFGWEFSKRDDAATRKDSDEK